MSKRRRGRDNYSIANDRRALPLSMSPPRSTFPTQLEMFPLRELEDRRSYHPEGSFSPARSFSKSAHRLTVTDRPRKYQHSLKKSFLGWSQTKGVVTFQTPKKVLICVRRKRRAEVLHALRKTGKVGQKRPRRNFYSDIHC